METKRVYEVRERYSIYWKPNFIRDDFCGNNYSRRQGFRLPRENSRMQIRVSLQYFESFINNFSLNLLGGKIWKKKGFLQFN